jgi:hypothetical protein
MESMGGGQGAPPLGESGGTDDEYGCKDGWPE